MGWNVYEVRDWKSGGTVGGRRYERKWYEVGNGIHWVSERIRGRPQKWKETCSYAVLWKEEQGLEGLRSWDCRYGMT